MKKSLAITATAIITGCAQPGGTGSSVGMANPASVYCQQKGGTLRIDNRPAGQVGICVFPDGTEIEEWTLYRRDHPERKDTP